MKRKLCLYLVCMLMFSNVLYVKAENNSGFVLETVSPEEAGVQIEQDLISPYTRYIMNAITHITDKGDGKIYMGVEVYCTQTMKKIITNFYLQQLIDGKWVDVCETTGSVEDSSYMIKFISVSYPPSGTYRVYTVNYAEDYYGYAEATDGCSGDIDFISPYT